MGRLLDSARKGNDAAWVRLVRKYREYLRLLARLQISRELQSKEDPSDLVQETLLNAYKNLGSFRGKTEEALVAWLREILANCLANFVRRYRGTQMRDVRLEKYLANELEQSSHLVDKGLGRVADSPNDHSTSQEQAVAVANALAKLPEHYRDVLILHHFENLKLADVAKKMKRSLRSVQGIWPRALIRMRAILDAGEANP
jgi:RNA polymerase sigma-70 factor (ECF subfamily)